MSALPLIISWLLGAVFGSFFNVIIYRLPNNRSIVSPPSHCNHCGLPIKWHENIPVFSYLFLRGRCSSCNTVISIQYPVVEFITGLLFMLIYIIIIEPFLRSDHSLFEYINLAASVSSLAVLVPLSVIDLKHYMLPDSITIPFLIIALISSLLPGGLTPLESITGAAVGGGLLLSIGLAGRLLTKKSGTMGGGDIKLMAFAGAMWGYKTALLAIFAGSLYGSLYGLVLILIKKLNREHVIPFGPFLSLGILTAVLFGNYLLNLYLNFLFSDIP